MIKIYPVNGPVWPADVSNSLRSTVHVAPAARFPLASSPIPGRADALVVNANGVPAPVAVRGKKFRVTVPDVAVAPFDEPNGSAVVLASAIPVSKAPSLTANGTSNVVVAGVIVTTVAGPTSAAAKLGYVLERGTSVLVNPVATGAIVAVTVILPGAGVMPEVVPTLTATSKVSTAVGLASFSKIVAVLTSVVTVEFEAKVGVPNVLELVPAMLKLNVIPAGIPENVSRTSYGFVVVRPVSVMVPGKSSWSRQALANPSTIRIVALLSGTVLFVKTEPVLGPATLAIPGP